MAILYLWKIVNGRQTFNVFENVKINYVTREGFIECVAILNNVDHTTYDIDDHEGNLHVCFNENETIYSMWLYNRNDIFTHPLMRRL